MFDDMEKSVIPLELVFTDLPRSFMTLNQAYQSNNVDKL